MEVSISMNFIEQARKIDDEDIDEVPLITQEIIEGILEEKVHNIELWIENRNSRIFMIKTKKNETIVGKQSKTIGPSKLENEYKSLNKLFELDCPNLSMPKTYGFNALNNIYLMDLVNGKSIASLIRKKHNKISLIDACRVSGKVIAEIHTLWNIDSRLTNEIEVLFEDLWKIPKGYTDKEHETLQAALNLLKGKYFPIGKVYKDFDPLNVFYNKGKISLIDPPEIFIENLLYWDLATFCIGLHKALLKSSIFKRNKSMIDKCESVFLTEYISNLQNKKVHIEDIKLMVSILELQRIGELMVFQEKHKENNNLFSKNAIYNRAAIWMLKNEKKRVLNEIRWKIANRANKQSVK